MVDICSTTTERECTTVTKKSCVTKVDRQCRNPSPCTTCNTCTTCTECTTCRQAMAAAGLEDSSLEDFELEEEGRQGQKKHFKNLDKKSKKEKGTKVIAEPLCIDVPIEVCHDEPIQQCRDVPRKHCTKTEKVKFTNFVLQLQIKTILFFSSALTYRKKNADLRTKPLAFLSQLRNVSTCPPLYAKKCQKLRVVTIRFKNALLSP